MSPNESYPQHVVTAVIVAHDGATWLPHVADAVLAQTRPVQRVVAVDTGSRDRSGAVLASKFGQAAVFGMDRPTGYGTAIARALQHRAAKTPVPPAQGGQAGERTEWLWLLHDDCEPAPDALEQLLRGTVETGSAAVLGPKIKDWANREVILEAGVTLDTATRRVTGIEPREVDQGQHDGDRDTLAVSSAGMLVRRDVWEQVGGFDTAMGLFMEDIDFCWRVHSAGYRVRVITDAVVYHARAATTRKRAVSVGRRTRMLDRRNGLLTLLGNLPMRPMLAAAVGNVMVSLLRVTFFLLAKRLAAGVDELAALVSVLCHPIRLIKMRRRRSRGRRAAFSRVRADLPPGHSVRRLAEFAVATLSKSQANTSGSHHATEDPTEDDSMLVDNGLGKRLLTSPTLLTFLLLTGISLAACWPLIGPGPLGGGSLVPAWGGSGSLWASYVQTFHPSGIGSTTPAPPWLAVVAALATVLGGKPWLAIDVLLIGCVPLSGLTAMFAVRKIARSGLVRVWASVTYALLPVVMGVVASGRFGTAVAFVLLPLIVAQAGRMMTQDGPRATRAAWATGLLVAIGSAFVPLLWVIALLACVLAAAAFRAARPGLLRNLAIVVLAPPVLLMPWTLTLLPNPAGLLLEAGLPQSGAPAFSLPARSLLLLSPGGPGLPPYWVTGGLLVVAFAALFAGRRRRLVIAGWGLALCGLLAGVVVSHLIVRPPDGDTVTVWAGLPLALAAIGLLTAAVAAADGPGRPGAGQAGWRTALGGRRPLTALLGLVACSAPVLAAASWLSTGISGPVHQVSSPVVPELVAAAGGNGRQVRTLVLRSAAGHISYLLLRGPSPSLADAAITPPASAGRALGKVVSALTTPGGSLAAGQAQLLADFDIGYVMVQAPVDPQLATDLNDISGMRPYSTTGRYSLWQLDRQPARVTVREPNGTVVPVPSGVTGVAGVTAPTAGGTLMLAEPAGGWSASVNGHALAAVPSPAGSWAQAFRLPSGGGTLTVGYSGLTRDLVLIFELLALVIVAALALPGIHVAEQDGAAAAGDRAAGRAAARAGSRVAGRRAPAGAGAAGPAAAGALDGGLAGADPAGAQTAVMERAGRTDADQAAADLTRSGLAGAELAAGAASAREGSDQADQADQAGQPGADVAAGRRGLVKGVRGRSQQSGRGARGRGARGRDAVRQRPGLGKAQRATAPATGAGSLDDADADDAAETTLLAAGPRVGDLGREGQDRADRADRAGLAGRRSFRQPRGRDGRLADARPHDAGSERSDGKLADAWPFNTGRDSEPDLGSSRGGGEFRPSGQHSYRPPREPADDLGAARRSGQHTFPGGSDRPGRTGRHGYQAHDETGDPLGRDPQTGPPGRTWNYQDEGSGGAGPRRPSGPGRRGRDDDLGDGPATPPAGWRSPAGRSPSGRSPGGDWPYPELDAPAGRDSAAGGRSPEGRAPDDSWPGQQADERPPWRAEQGGNRAYRLTGPGQTESRSRPGSGADRDWDADADWDAQSRRTGPQRRSGSSGEAYGGRPDRATRGRHGAGRRDDPVGWSGGARGNAGDWDSGSGPSSWPGADGGGLEPLPPPDSRSGGQGRRGARSADEDTGDWARFDDEPGDRRPHPAGYEPEYEGDSW